MLGIRLGSGLGLRIGFRVRVTVSQIARSYDDDDDI